MFLLRAQNLGFMGARRLAGRPDGEIENLPEAATVATVSVRTVSVGQFLMTRSELKLRVCFATQVYVANVPILETTLTCSKGSIGVNTKFGASLDGIGTKWYDLYGVEIKLNSLKEDGTMSWVVISRDIERYVLELALNHVDPMRFDQHTMSSARPRAWTMPPISSTSSSSRTDAPVPMEHRGWEHIPRVKRVEETRYPVSKKNVEFAASSLRSFANKTVLQFKRSQFPDVASR